MKNCDAQSDLIQLTDDQIDAVGGGAQFQFLWWTITIPDHTVGGKALNGDGAGAAADFAKWAAGGR